MYPNALMCEKGGKSFVPLLLLKSQSDLCETEQPHNDIQYKSMHCQNNL